MVLPKKDHSSLVIRLWNNIARHASCRFGKTPVAKYSTIFLTVALAVAAAYNLGELYWSMKYILADGWCLSFGKPGYELLNQSKASGTVVLAGSATEKDATIYIWTNPQEYDDSTPDFRAVEVSYFRYPRTVKTGPLNLKSPYDYIICGRDEYEDLNLYLVFFDMDRDFVENAKKGGYVMLKRKKGVGVPRLDGGGRQQPP